MSLGALNIRIDMDAKDVHVEFQQAGNAVRRFASQVVDSSNSVRRMERALTGLGAKIRHTFVNLALARTAMHNVWLATGAWQKSLMDTAGELERMQFLLRGLSTASNATEQIKEAAKTFDFLVDTAKSAPFSLNEITNSAVKFKSVGLDPMNGSLKSMLDAIAKFGGTDETLHRASVAIQQMAGKGVISMEELRQQLGEAVPSAMIMLARSMNMSVGSLVEAISKGQVVAGPALEKLFAQFETTFGGSSQLMMNTYAGQMSKLKTQWVLFQKSVADSNGLFNESKKVLAELVMVLDPKYLSGVGDIYSKIALNLLTALRNGVIFIYNYREEIKNLGIALFGAMAAFKAATYAAAAYNLVMGTQLTRTAAFASATLAMSNQVKNAARVVLAAVTTMGAGRATLGAMTGAATGLGNAFLLMGKKVAAAMRLMWASMLTNPIGWLLGAAAAVTALVLAYKQLTKSVDESREALKRLATEGYVSDKELREQTDFIRGQTSALKDLKDEAAELERKVNSFGARDDMLVPGTITGQTYGDLRKRLLEVRQLIKEEGSKLALDAKDLATAAERSMAQIAERTSATLQMDLAQKQNEIRASYESGFQVIQTAIDAAKGDQAKIDQIKESRRALLQRQADEILSIYEQQMTREMAAYDKASEQEKKSMAGRIATLRESIDQIREMQQQNIEVLMRDNTFTAGKDKDANKQNPLIAYIQNVQVKLAGMRAEMQETGKEVERFKEALMNAKLRPGDGDLASMTQGQLEAMGLSLAKQFDAAKADYDAWKATQAALKEGTEALAMAQANANNELEQAEAIYRMGGMDVANSKLFQFQKLLDRIRQTLGGATKDDLAAFEQKATQVTETLRRQAGFVLMNDLTQDIIKSEEQVLLTYEDRVNHQIELERRLFNERMTLGQLWGTAEGAQAQALFEQKMAFHEQLRKLETPMGELAKQWYDTTEAMKEATASWVDDGVESMVAFAETGKFSFHDMAKSILKDILRIILRGMIAQAILSAIGMIGGGSMNSQGIGLSRSRLSGAYDDIGSLPSLPKFARGGIMTNQGSMALKRYARGGVASRPQVAVFGEGDDPEAYVPLPDGRTIPVTMEMRGGATAQQPNVEVNVINESGVSMNAEQRGSRFDGKTMVLDIVLSAMQRPGAFRDGMRGSVR